MNRFSSSLGGFRSSNSSLLRKKSPLRVRTRDNATYIQLSWYCQELITSYCKERPCSLWIVLACAMFSGNPLNEQSFQCRCVCFDTLPSSGNGIFALALISRGGMRHVFSSPFLLIPSNSCSLMPFTWLAFAHVSVYGNFLQMLERDVVHQFDSNELCHGTVGKSLLNRDVVIYHDCTMVV